MLNMEGHEMRSMAAPMARLVGRAAAEIKGSNRANKLLSAICVPCKPLTLHEIGGGAAATALTAVRSAAKGHRRDGLKRVRRRPAAAAAAAKAPKAARHGRDSAHGSRASGAAARRTAGAAAAAAGRGSGGSEVPAVRRGLQRGAARGVAAVAAAAAARPERQRQRPLQATAAGVWRVRVAAAGVPQPQV